MYCDLLRRETKRKETIEFIREREEQMKNNKTKIIVSVEPYSSEQSLITVRVKGKSVYMSQVRGTTRIYRAIREELSRMGEETILMDSTKEREE